MATASAEPVPESRPLTADERALVLWMLEHGGPRAPSYLPHLDSARVVERRCPCGCASIDFSVGGKQAPAGDGLEVLADFQWREAGGGLCGAFVFARGGLLAGLDVWSVDGQAVPAVLPRPEALAPLEF